VQETDYTEREAMQVLGLRGVGILKKWRYRKKGPPYRKLGHSITYPKTLLHSWNEAQITGKETPNDENAI
jgi:hypothetical protein